MSNETTTAGRPPIDASRYYAQIEAWLTEGKRIDEITATMLQRTVGGQYKKISETLERYKTGYISKELMELPPVPDELGNAVNAAALEIWRILQGAKSKEIAELKEQQADDLAGLEQLAAERLDRVDELEQQIEVKDQETNNLKQQLKDAISTNNNLVDVNSRLDSELKQVTHQSQELMLELRQLRGELSVAQQTTIKQQANIEHLQEQLSKTEVQAKALAADNRQYQKTAELAQAKSD
ncbi:DNA-binding protein, partial [Shewanella sp. 4t3-1-2LB]|uniref:DNA-binding protein n=1 Tax=Shewanella sp. 4t3-1-2LB TaxID=2817682 RepID=UPI001A99D623